MASVADRILQDSLIAIVGAENVFAQGADPDHRTRDIFFDGNPTSFIVRPLDKQQVAEVAALAHANNYALFPRGGGMSYTKGYVPSVAQSILLDMSALDSVIAIDPANMFVTVQPGVTWKKLYEALAAHGLRLPAFGTISGANATVGGGLSQGSIFYGSTRYGPTAEHVLGLEVVLADGALIKTGQAATGNAKPFFRWYGPDLSGPFLGDCGALGIKVEMTFRVIPMPTEIITMSFGFTDFESLWQAQSEIARRGLAADCFSFDEVMQRQLMSRTSFAEDLTALKNVITGGSIFKGLKSAAKIAVGGKSFLNDIAYSLHIVAEDRLVPAARAAAAEIEEIAKAQGGRTIPDSVPQMMRANPFNSMDQVLGPSGERWVPVHGLVALSDGLEAMNKVKEVLVSYGPALLEHKIKTAVLCNPVGQSAMVIEILFYWPDAPHELHEKIVSASAFAKAKKLTANPAGRAVVGEMRGAILDCLAEFGSATLGIGRSVPYRRNRDQASYEVLQKIKAALDPSGILNPGVLGL